MRPEPDEVPGISECFLAGLVCNDSALVQKDGRWDAQGDPTEVALIVAARKAALDDAAVKSRLPRLDAIPFESQHQFMATLHDDPGTGRKRIYLKGAVEVVLERCHAAIDAAGQPASLDRSRVQAQVSRMTSGGLRLLAFAHAEVGHETRHLDIHNLPGNFTLIGLQGMIDPPRTEAIDAVAACHRAGIQVKMITGDHAGTAAAIGRQLGLIGKSTAADGPTALTGKDLAGLSEEALVDVAENISVFARVTPEQKLRLVEALQARGHIVAMTGDGVNDGPALKQANIGVAIVQALYLVNCRSLRHGIWSIGLFRNGWLWLGIAGVLLAQVGLTYLPFLNSIFQTAPIGWDEWLRILGAGLAGMVLVEFQKWLIHRRQPQP